MFSRGIVYGSNWRKVEFVGALAAKHRQDIAAGNDVSNYYNIEEEHLEKIVQNFKRKGGDTG